MAFQSVSSNPLFQIELDPVTGSDQQEVHYSQLEPDVCKIILFGSSVSLGVTFDPERNRYQLL
ncbi:MAG: hypothetical protein EHM45_17735, partial [Desulfobacteraceae bacterium]